MQALAILLTSNLPPVVKKKALYTLLNEAEIRFNKDELEAIEDAFKPVDVIACGWCHAPQPSYHSFCFNCGHDPHTHAIPPTSSPKP